MISITNSIGGIRIIKKDSKIIAWLDIDNDLSLDENLEQEIKNKLFEFLENNQIIYHN